MRILFTFIMSIAVYHWSLDELTKISPSAADYTQNIAEKIRIPTHDRWPVEEFMSLASGEIGLSEFASDAWERLQSSDS